MRLSNIAQAILCLMCFSTQSIFSQTISAGGGHTMVACSQWGAQGQSMVWGNNLYGQLGNSSTVSISTLPVYANISNVERVGAGWSHCAAVKKDGTLWTWGYNASGQLGQATTSNSIPLPTQVPGMTTVLTVACGHEHTLALKQNGTVWTCGINGQGQLGNGSNNPSGTFMQVAGLSSIIQVAGGYTHSIALKSDGTVWVWGSNSVGQLGTGTFTSSNTPQQNFFLSNVVFVAASGSHSLAVKGDGTVWAWGKNNFGQLGLGNTSNYNTPQQITAVSGAIAVAAGWEHSMVLKSDSTVWVFGRNTEGQLGTGNFVASNIPVQSQLPVGTKEMAAGTFHGMAIGSDNILRMWGNNYDGHCGVGTSQNYLTIPTATLSVCALATALDHPYGIASVSVFPNPARDELFLPVHDYEKCSIHDVNGSAVYESSPGVMKGSIDCSWMAPGVYTLQLIQQNRKLFLKFVIIR